MSLSVSSRLMKPSTSNQIGDNLIILGFCRPFLHLNFRQTLVWASQLCRAVVRAASGSPLYCSAKQTAPYMVSCVRKILVNASMAWPVLNFPYQPSLLMRGRFVFSGGIIYNAHAHGLITEILRCDLVRQTSCAIPQPN